MLERKLSRWIPSGREPKAAVRIAEIRKDQALRETAYRRG